MTSSHRLFIVATLSLGLLACARHAAEPAQPSPPAFLLGAFTDDYGSRYTISAQQWVHGDSHYHVRRWNVTEQYLIAQNDSANPSEPGLWTRIDWLPLAGMAPYSWGYCYSAFKAPSAAVAETVSVANRATPRTGCNGYPFSRMRTLPDSTSH